MPASKIILRPGIDVEETPLLNEASFSASNLVRFFQGLLQKLGGWLHINQTALVGTCRGLFAWADLSGVAYVACGTEQRLQIYNAGQIYDITPVRLTTNVSGPFSTTSGSMIVKVTDSTNGSFASDWINVITLASTPNGVLSGFYQIMTEIDGSNYDISVANNAASTATGQGVTSLFTTVNTSATATVTLNGHGYSAGSVYMVNVSTAVGGITFFGSYLVATVIDANNFTIAAGMAATSSTSGHENGGNVRIEYLLSTGLASPAIAQGYGEGGYGLGGYGLGASGAVALQPRQWSMGAFGQILVAAPTGGTIYEWDPSAGFTGNVATTVTNAPTIVQGIFIAMPQEQIVAYGITDPNTGKQDPMLIGWCDVANFNVWTAAVNNQAGTFRLPRGSQIVGGIQGPQYGMYWTDLGLWLHQYIGYPLVYGFSEIGQGCGLISMRSNCVLGGAVYWCSENQFFEYDGQSVQELPCAVWDIIFQNLSTYNQAKMHMGANSHFNEFFQFFPSLTGNGEIDSYVKFQKSDRVWDYGSLIRTAWFDQSVAVNGNPIGTDQLGYIQEHEASNDADGSPMLSSATTGWFKISDGLFYIFLERFLTDFVFGPSTTVILTVFMADYPNDTPRQYGPFSITNQTEYIIVRGRGRLGRVQISSSDLGSFWRLGELIYFGSQAGRR